MDINTNFYKHFKMDDLQLNTSNTIDHQSEEGFAFSND